MPKLKYKPIAFYPDLNKDWDYEKNAEKPEDLSAGSRNKAFWRCHNCGYEWQVLIYKRIGGHKCLKYHKLNVSAFFT